MHLHRPRSRLHYSTMEILCSISHAPPHSDNLSGVVNEHHTMQAMKAAKMFVELFTLSISLTTHSPSIMCMGSMAAATHISACEHSLQGLEYGTRQGPRSGSSSAPCGHSRAYGRRRGNGLARLNSVAKTVFDSRGKRTGVRYCRMRDKQLVTALGQAWLGWIWRC